MTQTIQTANEEASACDHGSHSDGTTCPDALRCDACCGQHIDDAGHPDPYEYAACAERHTDPPRSFWCLATTNAHGHCSRTQTWNGEACECPCHAESV